VDRRTEGHRERWIQRLKEKYGQSDVWTDTQTDNEGEREFLDRQIERWTDRKMGRQKDGQRAHRQSDRWRETYRDHMNISADRDTEW
jgi:hypothetical protein